MWKLIEKPVTVRATKKLANEFANMDHVINERPLSERRLMVYRRLLVEGLFRPVTWASAYCIETGATYRVNGQHTSIMISGLDTIPEFFVIIERYSCDTLEDVARLYSTFDSKMGMRNANDIYLSFAGTIPEFASIPRGVITLSVTGMGYAKWLDESSRKPASEKAELLLDDPEFLIWLNTQLSGGYGSHLRRAAVVAAMFSTWKKSIKDATVFWAAVRDETGTAPNLPDRKLARYLVTTGVEWASGASKVKAASSREFYVKCLHAWNAWRKNENTDLRYYPNKDIPSVK